MIGKIYEFWREDRASITMEAVLSLPILLVLFSAVNQTLLLAQNRVYLEQAAYVAARSAIVHMCPPFSFGELLQSPIGTIAKTQCKDNPKKWEDAARWALVAASPSSDFARDRKKCPPMPAAERLVQATSLPGNLNDAMLNRVCYAYEPENVRVKVEWVEGLGSIVGVTRPPMRATVTFRYPLTTPFRRFIDDGKRGDGTYYKEGTATVTLL